MNIETLIDHARSFNNEVIDSGLARDLDDYNTSLPASEENIVALRDIAQKVLNYLNGIYGGDLPAKLESLLPEQGRPPFTKAAHHEMLQALVEDPEIQQPEFFSKLRGLLGALSTQIEQNTTEIESITEFLEPYSSKELEEIAGEGHAILAVVFKEQQTITSLEHFSRALRAWNRTLPVYHQLLRSESPGNVEILEVQNGSIDIVININADVAIDLVDLFKIGFQVFVSYLSYKKMDAPFIESYHGNKKLIDLESEREPLLLENIGTAIQARIEDQHKAAKKGDKGIDDTAVDKKVEQVTKLITSHIVKGNDLKLLALPPAPETGEGDGEEESAEGHSFEEERDALIRESSNARRHLRELSPEAKEKLLDAYGELEDGGD